MQKPELKKIDKEKFLYGEIELRWTIDTQDVDKFEIFRSKYSNLNPEKEQPIAEITKVMKNSNGEFCFTDKNFPKDTNLYYIVAASKNGEKIYSRTELVKTKILELIEIDEDYLKNAAYYESIQKTPYDKKVWRVAELGLIFKMNFSEDLVFLRKQLQSIKRAFPKFSGKLAQPLFEETKAKAKELYLSGISISDLDWHFIERELIYKKLLYLIDFEYE